MTLTAIEPGGCAPLAYLGGNASGIEPLDLKVLIKPDKAEEKIGSVFVPQQAQDQAKFAATRGVLVGYGPNAFKEWGEANVPAKGVRVLFGQYSGKRFKGDDGEDYLIANDEDVIGVVS